MTYQSAQARCPVTSRGGCTRVRKPWVSHSLQYHSGQSSFCHHRNVPYLSHVPRRPSLIKYHTQLLTLVGEGTGKWTLQRIGTPEERLSVGREIEALEKKLADVEVWEKRVEELERMLGAEKWDPEAERAEAEATRVGRDVETVEDVDEEPEPINDDFDESTSEFGAPSVSENGSEAVAITESMLQE